MTDKRGCRFAPRRRERIAITIRVFVSDRCVEMIGHEFEHALEQIEMIETLNAAALSLMISVGHRTKLFDVMAKIDPATSEQIARAARLNERYVREWLGAMVAGGVVEYYPANETYYLPSEHAASLTRAAAPVNIASTMQFIPVIGAVEDQIVECFLRGGAPPYWSHPRFQEALAGESDTSVSPALPTLMDSIVPLVPGLAEAICTQAEGN